MNVVTRFSKVKKSPSTAVSPLSPVLHRVYVGGKPGLDCRKESSVSFFWRKGGVAINGNVVVYSLPALLAGAGVDSLELRVEALPKLILGDA